MKRNLIAAFLVVAATFLLVGGSALAQFVQCNARLGGECRGTAQADRITGSIHPSAHARSTISRVRFTFCSTSRIVTPR